MDREIEIERERALRGEANASYEILDIEGT